MKLKVGEKIPQLKSCYELVLNYANRDDELTSKSFIYKNEDEIVEILEVLNEGLNVDYMNGYCFYKDIPNFSKHFIFQDANGRFPEEKMEEWTENVDKSIWEIKDGIFTELEHDDRILWDYQTCSGEIELEIWSYELYLYDENGNKYKMEVEDV
jgi:hypothetical protein